MKIGYFADGPWAHRAFEKIVNHKGFAIDFICVRNDSEDMVFKNFARQWNIPLLKHPNVNSEEFLNQIGNFKSDIFVSMSFNQIFKKTIMNMPPLKTINCHAGKLPFYRGRNILNWVLINDEKEYGVTVHYIDEGIDTGDIILQKSYPITDEDTYATLLERAYANCSDLLYEALLQIEAGAVKIMKQKDIHPVGMYCGQRKPGDEALNWNQTSRQIFNFVRAICKPGPQAVTHVNSGVVKINSVKFIQEAPQYTGIPGQVIGKNGNNPLVKTTDSYVELIEFTSTAKIKIGDRFQ